MLDALVSVKWHAFLVQSMYIPNHCARNLLPSLRHALKGDSVSLADDGHFVFAGRIVMWPYRVGSEFLCYRKHIRQERHFAAFTLYKKLVIALYLFFNLPRMHYS